MMPIGPLMIEHRLIERMISLMDKAVAHFEKEDKADIRLIDTAIDFISVYADKCHHGKEEDILFRELKKKKVSPELEVIMNELIAEHVLGRRFLVKLSEEKEKYANGDGNSLCGIIENSKFLIDFYPKHIEKEDKHFFLPCMQYFSQAEQDKMLGEMWEFDRMMIHQKYTDVVTMLEQK